MDKKGDYFILCDEGVYNEKEREISNKPLLLYENGTLEIESVAEFKDYTDSKTWRASYKAIEDYMGKRDLRMRDLRDGFCPRYKLVTVIDVLYLSVSKECYSRLELAEMVDKRQMERIIYNARKRARSLLGRQRTKAIERRSSEDLEFLRKIGKK